ncbi:MAG: cytochrome b [Caulobacteraceae bacterium]
MVRTRYSTIAILFHWIIAALILINLYLGFRMGLVQGLAKFNIFQLHKSIGITVLILSVLRLAWRLVNRPPPEAPGLQPWERVASLAVHWGFYVIMIGMPLTGWIVVSTSPLNIPTLLYHTVPWPHFPGVHTLAAGPKTTVNHAFDITHVVLAWGAVVLLALHVGAVVKHQFLDRHPVLGRMLPLGRRARLATES